MDIFKEVQEKAKKKSNIEDTSDAKKTVEDFLNQFKTNKSKSTSTSKTPVQKLETNLSAYQKFQQQLENQGLLPKGFSTSNIFGKMKSSFTFPIQKIFGVLTMPERIGASVLDTRLRAAKQRTQAGLVKPTLGGAALEATKQTFGFGGNVKNDLSAMWQAISQTGNYANQNFAQTYKTLPDSKFTKDFSYAQNTDDWVRGTNWLQKLTAGFAGSPSDIAGFATDIVVNPLTFFTGGVGKGASTGFKLGESLIAKGAKVILPKGAMVALKGPGKKLLQEGLESSLPKALQGLNALKTTGDIKVLQELFPALKITAENAKILTEISQPAAKNFLTSLLSKQILKDTISNMSAKEAAKLIDYGGMKVFGQTVLPGYKFAGIQEAKISTNKLSQTLQGLFNTTKDMPEDYKYINRFVRSLMGNREKQGAKLLADITKGMKQKSLDKIQEFGALKMDVERLNNELNFLDIYSEIKEPTFGEAQQALFTMTGDILEDVAAKATKIEKHLATINEALNKVTKTITPEELAAYNRYQTEFAQGFLQKVEEMNNIFYKKYQNYMPLRDMSEKELNTFLKKLEVGSEKSVFEQEKVLTYLQRKAAGINTGNLQENSLRRIQESATRIGRSRLLNEVKQFGSLVKEEGFVKSALKELDGWYLPEQIQKATERTKALFFSEDAFRQSLKAYDKLMTVWKRLALATPGYHFRNLFSDTFSGVMEYGLDYLNPNKLIDAMTLKRAELGSQTAKDTILTTKGFGGKALRAQDVLDEFLESGVMGGGQYYKEALAAHGLPNTMSKISLLEMSSKIGGHREDLGRMIAGLIEKEAGSNAMVTASNVKKIFFDYTDLTLTEQNIFRKFLVPFYAWNKKNTLRQFELMLTRTGKYATIPKTLNFIEDISQKPEGYDEYKPDYYKENAYTLTPFKTPSGSSLVLNPNLPFQGLSMLSPNQWINAGNPLIKLISDIAYGKIQFSKKNLTADTISEAPYYLQFLKYLPQSTLMKIGFAKSADGSQLYYSNMTEFLLNQIPTAATMGRLMTEDPTKQSKKWLDMWSTLGGLKFAPYDPEMYKEMGLKKQQSKYQDMINKLQKLNILPDDFTLTNIKKQTGTE